MKPDLNDVGIIGQRIPNVNADVCKGCKKCAIEAACPNKVAKVVDGKIQIDKTYVKTAAAVLENVRSIPLRTALMAIRYT